MGQWWTPERIDATVTRAFIVQHLEGDEVDQLDRPVGFTAEALTERTYLEAIQSGAKKLFLILVDVGVPDQIFGIIDDGWDDEELPLSLEDIERLSLMEVNNDRVNRKFQQRQGQYILKTIEQGEHQTYEDTEQVPIDVVERVPPLPTKGHHVDKVRLPNVPGGVFTRRRYTLGKTPGSMPMTEFLEMVSIIKTVQSEHMVSYWGSYTHQGYGYILLTPISEYSLKTFLGGTPSAYKGLPKKDRREIIMNWILCLVDTMCSLHVTHRAHCYIKPSAILFTNKHNIFLVDPARLSPDASSGKAEKTTFDREWYDYAAPEQWFQPSGPGSPPTRKTVLASLTNAQNQLPIPNPSQQADIFSLGCIILELLSFLLKRSTSKFASFRSAKLKKGGRGGAVLDTSFHKNLGQVEEWMTSLAKDAARKASESRGGATTRNDGAHVFRGFTPMLHIVAEMLAANPFERPSALEVQRRTYEPHCVHRYEDQQGGARHGIPHHAFAQMSLRQQQQPVPPALYQTRSYDFAEPGGSPPPLLDRRSSGYSEASRTSGSTTTGSSERSSEYAGAGRVQQKKSAFQGRSTFCLPWPSWPWRLSSPPDILPCYPPATGVLTVFQAWPPPVRPRIQVLGN
ncbi:kinase-like domain-containing protein [Emericellopsis atlantica]|uniref:Kinase-like domain-containing protein n=1 Tax=Emericellopsis atlantica TaxID=2614577 RepID=A0A9P8CRK2_9HYPO|nr:kinase-like domain-containing protein [Emericellopsis atlantica]KAG9256407.1 kinase-like domain-containing protein [Emericellopsis atlantica]